MIDFTLSCDEARRVAATLGRLRHVGLDPALTGGLAIAWHVSRREGTTPTRRPLHDLDIVVEDIRSIPDGLAAAFEVWHIHADAPPGRMLVQLYDRSTALRIDVFGAYGSTLSRCIGTSLLGAAQQIVSREDLAARLCSVLLDLALDEAVDPKHARDFSALVPGSDAATINVAWREHRRSRHPTDFEEARMSVLDLVRARPDLLAVPYSPYLVLPCPRCRPHILVKTPRN